MADLNIFGTTFSNASGFKIEDTEGNLRTFTEGSGVEPVQSDWNEEGTTSLAHVLNRPAIRAGEGENSVVIGHVEDDSDSAIYTIYITYDATNDTYSFTTTDTLPSATNLKNYGIFYFDNTDASGNVVYSQIEDINLSSGIIKFVDKIIITGGFPNNKEAKIYYKQHTKANGEKSIAAGASDFAIGKNSYAFGQNCFSYAPYSVSEGRFSGSYGSASHAEGARTRTLGNYSHAEGSKSESVGSCSHAEGSSTAIGNYSHSEGQNTVAKNDYSHAEGYNTVATGNGFAGQHVQGKWNVEDTRCEYAHIVGNGTAEDARSNAHTLDWSGNGWYAGKLTVGAGPVNNMDVATKQYVDQNAGGDASIAISSNVITLTNASGQTSSITLPVYSGAVSGGAS